MQTQPILTQVVRNVRAASACSPPIQLGSTAESSRSANLASGAVSGFFVFAVRSRLVPVHTFASLFCYLAEFTSSLSAFLLTVAQVPVAVRHRPLILTLQKHTSQKAQQTCLEA